MKLTIGTKLALSFGLIIMLMTVSATVAYYNVAVMRGDLDTVVNDAIPTSRAVDQVQGALHASIAAMRGYVIFSAEPDDAERFESQREDAWTQFHEHLARLKQSAHDRGDSGDQRRLVEIVEIAGQLRGAQQAVVRATHAASAPSATQAAGEAADQNGTERLMEEKTVPLGRELKSKLSEIAASAEARRAAGQTALDAAAGNVVMSLFSATVAGVLVGTIVALVLSRKIISMVRLLADRARQISQGDLTGQSIATRASDELGQLADGFDTMLGNLRDLTGQILSVTGNINSATAQISSSAGQQASSTKEQAAAVQEITSTMQELSQSGTQIVEKAREVAAAVEATVSASRSGSEAVQSTSRTMEAIRDQVEEVAENIVTLSEKTQAIGEIVATVNDIAERSNLLALNATIEAADAGEQGGRFSVVAAEMKNLADQAKQCTVQVRKILGEIQKGINTSVMLTEEAVKRVESGKNQADISEGSIRQMSATTDESVQVFQQIIAATSQQQVGFEQVAKGMQDIDTAAQQTASGTVQLEQAAASLSALSKQLQTAVANYRI